MTGKAKKNIYAETNIYVPGSESLYPRINGDAVFVLEGALGDALLGIPAINYLRNKFDNLIVFGSDRVIPFMRRLIPSVRFVNDKTLVSADQLFLSTGFLCSYNYKGEANMDIPYPPGRRLRDVHVATMNLINVGAGVWDCDFSPEFKDFERPEYLSSPSVVMINGTLVQSWKLWNRGEMNKTADMMRRKGMYVVNIFWENNSYDVVLDKADRHLNSPEPDEVLGLMAHADVVISNDTGMAHLRALFKKPQIVNWVIGSTKLHKQLNPYARIVIGKCSAGRTKDQCYGEKYYRICNDKICQNISALEVVKEANEMLGLYSNIRY